MSFIAGILSKELTCIPGVLSKHFGKFYSNALCNGCTWLFIIWYILHSGLDYALNELFRKMRFKEYNRIRLKHSLWYLGFYFTAFIYTGATLFQSRVNVLGFSRLHTASYNDISSDLVLGFMLMFTFFLHSAFWEVMEYDSKSGFASYILLSFVLLTSFFLRILEIAFTLTAFVSITQVAIESAKLLYIVTKKERFILKIIGSVLFGLSICSFVMSYLIGVPLIFLIPFGRKIVFAHLPAGYIPFTLLLSGWYMTEISHSPLFKLVNHCLFHAEKSPDCCGNMVECSMFRPRNDVAFNLMQLRKEIQEREERLLALKKQSKKGVLMQTIKCMVNLKRKIHARRSSADKSSDKDSEESSDSCEWSKDEHSNENERLLAHCSQKDGKDDVAKGVELEVLYLINKVEDVDQEMPDEIKDSDSLDELCKKNDNIHGADTEPYGDDPVTQNDSDEILMESKKSDLIVDDTDKVIPKEEMMNNTDRNDEKNTGEFILNSEF